MERVAAKLGGLVEFYRSPARIRWTPTGVNVPDYAKLAQLWWQSVSDAIGGSKTPQQAMDNLAREHDRVLERLERANVQPVCGPELNPKKDPEYWLKQPGSPKPKLVNEKPQGQTIAYDELIKRWQNV